jgi:thiamine biosynthesis lipoprotein
MTELSETTRTFRVMNTDVTGIIYEIPENRIVAERALSRVELLFRLVERILSRFQPDSELSALNNSAGKPFQVSSMLLDAVIASLKAAQLTGGIFDPTVLPDLLAAGYSCSFENLDPKRINLNFRTPKLRCDWRKILVDPVNRTILLPVGYRLDLGGIGKGWAVDQAYPILKAFPDFALDAGGDIRVQGRQNGGDDWCVGVDDPLHPGQDLTVLHLSGGAVCTSTTTKRRWQAEGQTWHHLIDPRTGIPSQSGVISVTVTADNATRAEVLAKAALIAGPIRGLQLIEKQPGCKGLMILDDGAVLSTGLEVAQSVA